MNLNHCIFRLETNRQVIDGLFRGVTDEQARWKPDADSWSLLEVVNHLYDEEREDFRMRVDLMLHRPDIEFPPIHPDKWVTERSYNLRDCHESLENWLRERGASITWLRNLKNPDWEIARIAPWDGEIKAGDFMLAWVAHDFLHIRQMNELHYAWHKHIASPYHIEYSGDW
jgi:hypothetical protein